MLALVVAVLLAASPDVSLELSPTAPATVLYGAAELSDSWQALGLQVAVGVPAPLRLRLTADPDRTPPDGFEIRPEPGGIELIAGDDRGAMYALLELADWLPAELAAGDAPAGARRPAALKLVATAPPRGSRKPAMRYRGATLLLAAPSQGAPSWLGDRDWWTRYLDLLAHARFNALDLRGLWRDDPPGPLSILPLFTPIEGGSSTTAERERHRDELRWILAEAVRRGLDVSLLSLRGAGDLPSVTPGPMPGTPEQARLDAVRRGLAGLVIDQPDLSAIGLDLADPTLPGNSVASVLTPAAGDAARRVDLVVRPAPGKVPAGTPAPSRLTAELPFGGEQYLLPYIVAGGRAAQWPAASYGDWTNHPQPHRLVFRVEPAATRRVLPWSDPEWARITGQAASMAGAAGVTVAAPAERPAEILTWGRVLYSPDDPHYPMLLEAGLPGRDAAARQAVSGGLEACGRIVSLIGAVCCAGPMAADAAPDLSPGPPAVDLAEALPLDTFVLQSVGEFVQQFLTERPDPRLNPLGVAEQLELLAGRARAGAEAARQDGGEALAADLLTAALLADFWRDKLAAAVYLGIFEQTELPSFGRGAVQRMSAAVELWRALVRHTNRHYGAISDPRHLHDPQYHWRKVLPAVEADLERLRSRVTTRQRALAAAPPAIRHHPLRSSALDGPLMIQAEVTGLPAGAPLELDVLLEQRDGSWTAQRLERDEHLGLVALIDTTRLSDHRIRYVLRARSGQRLLWLPAARQREPFEVRVFRDGQPSVVDTRSVELGRKPDRMTLRVKTYWLDDDGLAVAWLWQKPMPAGRSWRKTLAHVTAPAAQGEPWTVTADVRATPEGAMYAVEVVDAAGWAERWPMFRPDDPDIPYRWVDPWEGPAPEPFDITALTAEQLADLRFAGLVVGRAAGRFAATPPAFKARLLDAVTGGATLVLFNQDLPDAFDTSWLPGDVVGSDADADELRLVRRHPLTEGLPLTMRGDSIANDCFASVGAGWQTLTDPPCLAVRRHGEGRIVLIQARLLELHAMNHCERMLGNLMAYLGATPQRPLLVLDWGAGALNAALGASGALVDAAEVAW